MVGEHGGNVRRLAQQAGICPGRLLDFSASINPLGPPEGLRAVISREIENLVHYPDPDCAEVGELLAKHHGVQPEQVVVGNGSTEILFALARALAPARAVIPVPSYIDYAKAARSAGRTIEFLRLEERDAFVLSWPALEERLRGDEYVLLGQPNNPTGLTFDVEEFARFAIGRPNTTFVVDEAFADFIDGYRSLAERHIANVIVVRSLTKFYAIPGLRLGYGVADGATAARIRDCLLPWSVNVLAQKAAMALLSDKEYAQRTVALVARNRRRLARELADLRGIYVYPSVANFLLVRVDRSDVTATELADRLLREGIAIRTFGASQCLDSRFFRVAVRTDEENARLIDALARAMGCPRKPRPKPVRAKALMIQGCGSNAGKSVLAAAFCRILLEDGFRVAPFKAQNMSLNSFVTREGGEMGRAQVVQAQACRLEPDVRMNPILLKPNSETGSQVIARGKPVGHMRVGEYVRYKPRAFAVVRECYDSLAAEFEAIVLEGAGSPGEINLKSHDIVNMRMAEYAAAPVLIVGDIDRGGVFASFVGTMEVLAEWERRWIAGWIVNRFRGDRSLLTPALDYMVERTGRPVLGVVPYLPDLGLPQEDSVEFKSGSIDPRAPDGDAVEIAVVDLPHIANFTDFDAFRDEPDVRLRFIRAAEELGSPDAAILPGSKNTLEDLEYLRRGGLADRLVKLAREGKTELVGICGGLQILGREVRDPIKIESARNSVYGLGLLGATTVMAEEKTLIRAKARHGPSGLEVTGYEIHHGQTSYDGCQPWFVRDDGQVVGVATDDGRVWGTYLHGLFDADAFRRWFIDRLRARRGLPPLGRVVARYDIEPALERLALVVRQSVRMDEVYRIMGLR